MSATYLFCSTILVLNIKLACLTLSGEVDRTRFRGTKWVIRNENLPKTRMISKRNLLHDNPNIDYLTVKPNVDDLPNVDDVIKEAMIFPGTKWCGPGDIARDYDDLGILSLTDACCRKHDHCDDLMIAGETKYNLTNTASYTRLSCKCDEEFLHCLDDVNTPSSRLVGVGYFDIVGTSCYRKDYQAIGCKRRDNFLAKCLEYIYNRSSEKVYQWFDVPKFKAIRLFIADVFLNK